MKTTLLVLGVLVGLATPAESAYAQEDCDQLCGTIVVNGMPVGFGCTGGGDRNRTNCTATVEDCTTDPCGGFALLTSTGIVLDIGTCQERARFLAEAGAFRRRLIEPGTGSEPMPSGHSLSVMANSISHSSQ